MITACLTDSRTKIEPFNSTHLRPRRGSKYHLSLKTIESDGWRQIQSGLVLDWHGSECTLVVQQGEWLLECDDNVWMVMMDEDLNACYMETS